MEGHRFTFVTGFPRSRTAWLSELLTARGHSFCFHEGTMSKHGQLPLIEYDIKLHEREEEFVLDSNSGLLLLHEMVLDWPDTRILLIDHDPVKARISHEKFIRGRFDITADQLDQMWANLGRGFEILKSSDRARVFRSEDLNSIDACRELAEFAAPNFPFDDTRFDELRRKNVQQNLNYWV